VDADPEAIRDLAYSITRVLNRDGEAVGPWAGLLSDEALLAGLRDMMTLRAFDSRMLMAQRQGKTSFYMQHMGEEAVSCAFRKALLPGDMNFPTYRQAGLLIAAGHSLVDMMCQIYSNEQDPLKGRQLPVLYSSKEDGFFSVSGNLATQYIQAVGSRRAASASASLRSGWTATTISLSTPWPAGRPSARDATWGPRSSSTSPTGSAHIRHPTIPQPIGPRPNPTPGRSATR
jgi:2-oxoisovalerate dehydrogenase E1 component alpha subunit